MALRARLAPPPPPPRSFWPYHTAKIGSIAARPHVLFGVDRRMEAETYLSSGYGIRTAIESKSGGWKHLSQLARSWQPGRLKGMARPSRARPGHYICPRWRGVAEFFPKCTTPQTFDGRRELDILRAPPC